MTQTVDLQGEAIGVGTLLALIVLVYGTIISPEIAGFETVAVANGVFTGTFFVVAGLHVSAGQHNLAWGHIGAGAGLLFVITGETPQRVSLGLFLLVLSGLYIALLVLRGTSRSESE